MCVGCSLQEDYRRAVDEYDEKVFHSFRLMLREVANVYVSSGGECVDVGRVWMCGECVGVG